MKKTLALVLSLVLVFGCLSLAAAEPQEGRVINVMVSNRSYDMNTDYCYDMLKELTGYDVNYSYFMDTNSLVNEVASGTEMDILQVSTSQFQTLLANGALKDINFALDAFPSVREAIADFGWAYCTGEDGGIYGIPAITDAIFWGGIGYRTDIFAQYGYEEPNTIDEFYDLLVKIKNDTGMIPYTGCDPMPYDKVIPSAFGLCWPYYYDQESDSIKSYLRKEGMKEYLSWMAKAYSEGLIDVDLPVNKKADVDTKMSSNLAVMTLAAHSYTLPWVTALVESGIEDAYFKTIIPLEDKNGERHIPLYAGMSNVAAFPVTASDDDVLYAMEMIASRLDPDTYWAFNVGIEGVHHTLDENGYPVPILPAFNDDLQYGTNYQIGRNKDVHPITWMARVHKTQVQWDTFYDANSKASQYEMEGDPLLYASFPAFNEYSSALEQMCTDYFLQVISGAVSIDTYDDFVAEWEQSGGLELEEQGTVWYHENPNLVAAGVDCGSPFGQIFGMTAK